MGFFDNELEPGHDALKPCPRCEEDKIFRTSDGMFAKVEYICDVCGYEADKNEVWITLSETFEEINKAKNFTTSQNTNYPDFINQIVSDSKGNEVTAGRLTGDEKYFYNIIPYLEQDELPHYVFPLTKGFTADPALLIESGGEAREAISNHDGGSVVVTNYFVRIHNNYGEWTIPYESISTIDRNNHPGLEIQTSHRTYQIRIAGTVFELHNEVALAIDYIRKKRRNSKSGSVTNDQSSQDNSVGEDPFKKLDKLKELNDNGVLTNTEYNNKKEEILNRL